ncbi:MAG: VWA domain-containing protein [Gemmatimonadales bacterium]
MSFGQPWVLAVAAMLLSVGTWLVVRAERRRRAALKAFGDPAVLAHGSSLPRRTGIRWTLRLAGLLLALLAVARPQLGERTAGLARTGRDVLVLLDLSRSMNATDAGGTRLGAAKRLVWETISASPGDRVGLVVFGGSAFLQLPLTSDQAALKLFLDAASSDDLGDPATDLSVALRTAARTFEHEGEMGRQAVLVASDGESGEGDLDAALNELRLTHLPVFTIGVGTSAGAPMPPDSSKAPDPYHRDNIGRVVISRLAEDDLRRTAEATGGRYARWDRAQDLAAMREAVASLPVRTLAERTGTERADRFQWVLAPAVVLLIAEMLLGGFGRSGGLAARVIRRERSDGGILRGNGSRYARARSLAALGMTYVWLGLTALGIGSCTATWRGERHYARAEYPEAYQAFSSALAKDSSSRLRFNTGAALYRLERYEAAANAFRAAARGATTPAERRRALYNLGNAMVRAAEEKPGEPEPLLDAVAAFEGALRLEPADADAKWNLEIALRRLGDDRTPGGTSGRGRNADYGRGDMNVPGYEGNPDAAVGAMAGGGFGSAEGESVEELSEEEARQLLDAVQRQQLTTHEGRPSQRGPRGERDW